MKKIMLVILFFLLIIPFFPEVQAAENSDENIDEWVELGAFRDTTYYRTYAKWLSEGYKEIVMAGEEEFKVINSSSLAANAAVKYNDDYAEIETGGSVNVEVEVEETGLYELGLSYMTITDFTSLPYVGIKISSEEDQKSEYQFNEISNIALEVSWNLEQRSEEDRYNRHGNELLPYSRAKNVWYKHYLDDTNARYVKPYKVLLKEGKNTVTVENLSSTLKLKSVYLNNTKDNVSYENYIANYSSAKKISEVTKINAEVLSEKNDIEIKASYYKDAGMTPNSYKNTVLNILDGSSTSRGGSKATYTFEVDETGLYAITLKYLQNTLNGLCCAKSIYLDGQIPFKEFECYLFPEAKKWTNHTLNNNGENYYVYLEKGTHTLSLETTSVQYTDLIERLYIVMDAVNTLGLTVASITGSSTNKFTDWNIVKYLPTIEEDLKGYATELQEVYDAISDLYPGSKEASEVSSLKVAAKQLNNLAKRPNKIHLKLAQLNSGSGSAYQLVGNAISALLSQPIDIDTIYVTGDVSDLPKAQTNFFKSLWFSICSFFYSFVDERYKITTDNDDEVLEVWVAQSNLYIDIIQSMADTTFEHEVKISMLPSNQILILNNATDTNPDVVLSIDSWEPYNYALRGMLEDLSQYEGFNDVTKNIYSNCFTPVIYDEGVYAIPETQGLNLLFYRKDILGYLGLEEPRTWEDVIAMLPILQSYQMNFYHPLGSESSYKNYSSVTPFIYGFGGEVFAEDGYTTVLTDERVVEAIQYMTDLYNVYNLPLQVASFFESFRSGTLPVGIGSLDMYLQLKYAAPELSGQWGICPVPGFDNDNNGEPESWTTAYGKSSILFKSSHMKEEGWDFIKWWNSTAIQTEYLQNIKMCLGEKYLVIPANVDALRNSNWDQEIKQQVSLAAKWSRIPAVTPGSYIVEREFSNIWNSVVIDKVDVRIAVSKSIDVVNRELARKFEEFGLGRNDYVVPNNSNIDQWIKEGRKHDE